MGGMGPDPAIAAMRTAVRDALRSLPAGSAVLVACSGGADSLALASATAFVAPRIGLRAGLVTVDHGLQPGSPERARQVAALGYELGLDPVEVLTVSVDGPGGPEAAARSARYAALDGAADALQARVLLGHTLDDQAETVLLGLARGSGARSLAGMAAVTGPDGRWLRPLLGLRRASTLAACAAVGLDAWQDPHNTDPAFTRARLRAEVLPLLEDVLHGGVAPALARTADLLRADAAALDTWAVEALAAALDPAPRPPSDQQARMVAQRPFTPVDHQEGAAALDPAPDQQEGAGGDGSGGALDVAMLAGLPQAIRTRVLRRWAAGHGAAALTGAQTAALEALVMQWHGQGPVALPGGVAVRRRSGRLVVCRFAT